MKKLIHDNSTNLWRLGLHFGKILMFDDSFRREPNIKDSGFNKQNKEGSEPKGHHSYRNSHHRFSRDFEKLVGMLVTKPLEYDVLQVGGCPDGPALLTGWPLAD